MARLILDRLRSAFQIVAGNGTPTAYFERLWQRQAENLETIVNAQIDLIAAIEAANTAAATATTAATAAQTAADTVTADASLANSYVTGITITATDAGASVTVNISAHTRVYGDGTSVAVNASSVTGLLYSTFYYFYYDDPTRAGGAITAAATISDATAAQVGNRHTLGSVTTPAALGAPVGGVYILPPGVGNIP